MRAPQQFIPAALSLPLRASRDVKAAPNSTGGGRFDGVDLLEARAKMAAIGGGDGGMVPLAALIRRELKRREPEKMRIRRERVTACGGEGGRLSIVGGAEIGPLRCWPGGLCLSRSIGDMDVGEFIVPIPHVKQVKLAKTGGRLIIASDGIWDALPSEIAAKCCRGLTAELAARQVVKEALRSRGLKDDTTCIVVDLIPPNDFIEGPPSPPKELNKLKCLGFRKKSRDSPSNLAKKLSAVGVVEELFEEGSAMLAERLGGHQSASSKLYSSLFKCAICQLDLAPCEGISVHAGSRPWEGPFLCADCRNKKDAMEGKRPSGVKVP
ncbi:probable protein phosphatase 2C 3 [Phalaenopsis equestris]|uniref:probable protein phosphatase 2C 3 n=1 Tax=Phalaenopsis equestris TaxID=78828 RepID=UPI0009E1A5EA|nr:probable protein phosphatase 2C 3 [Phalaenopsis equestris]